MKRFMFVMALVACPVILCGFQDIRFSRGQTVYVSVYSNIFTAPKGMPFHLDATLFVRNTDPDASMTVTSADFYDTGGVLLKNFVVTPMTLKPLETIHFFIPEGSEAGGVGANFVVKWEAKEAVNVPIIECLMSGTKSNQGISFIVSGQVIKESGAGK